MDDVLEMLSDDMVSHGWFTQYLKQAAQEDKHPQVPITEALKEILESGKVEIGETRAIPGYVEFIAWKGSIAERIVRAMNAVAAVSGHDKDFAYWMALRENVDRFEDEPPGNPEQDR
jgi:hypothetical protein